jgi:hypothetical protein
MHFYSIQSGRSAQVTGIVDPMCDRSEIAPSGRYGLVKGPWKTRDDVPPMRRWYQSSQVIGWHSFDVRGDASPALFLRSYGR